MKTGRQRRARAESLSSLRWVIARILALLSVSACSAACSTVATPQSRGEVPITGARLRAHMSVLSADDMEGRETGTPGFDRAAAYVADQLRSYGLRPAAEDWFQPLTIRRARVIETGTSLVLRLPAQEWRLRYGEDYVTYGVHREGEQLDAAGDLVFAGDGVSVPDRGLNAYQHLDVRNKIVVLAPGAPPTLSVSERSFFADAKQKAATAAAHGALAVLLFDDPKTPWALRVNAARQLGTSETRPLDTSTVAPIPVLYLHQRFTEPLLETASTRARRPIGSIAGSRATLQLRQQAREVRSANVWAVLAGREARLSRELVVVVAHVDHVGIGEPSDGDAIYNGAVDNASGVAALLEIARTLAAVPPARSMLFLGTTGEEQGLVGARAFLAQRDRLRGPLVAALNIDGASTQPFRTLDVRGGSQSSLGALAEEAGRRAGIGVRHESLGVGGSDHAPFLLAGIPPIWIGAALPDDWMRTRYHTPQDDMAQPIDFNAAAAYTRFVSTLARLVADAPARPAWREGEFFGRLR